MGYKTSSVIQRQLYLGVKERKGKYIKICSMVPAVSATKQEKT